MKKCYRCKKSKSLSEFHKNKVSVDGLTNTCKTCTSIKARRATIKRRIKNTVSKRCTLCDALFKTHTVKMYCDIHTAASVGKHTFDVVKVLSKPCSRCKLVKPAAEFYICKRAKSNLASSCKACINGLPSAKVLQLP